MSSLATEGRNLRDIVGLVARQRSLLILFTLSAMVTSLVLTFVFSERFRAATIVMYRPTDAVKVQPDVAIPDKTALGFPVPTTTFDAVGDTIERIGKSERVLRRVVVDLGLDQPEQNTKTGIAWLYTETKSTVRNWMKNAWQVMKYGRVIHENPTTDAIIGLMKYVTIETRENYTSTITMTDKYPDRAAQIVDKIAVVLVEEVKELSVFAAKEQAEKLAERLAVKGDEIREAQARIEKLKAEGGFNAIDDDMRLRIETAERFEMKLLQNEIALSDAQAALAALKDQREKLEPTVPSSQTVEDDPLYGNLQILQARYEVESEGLGSRLGPNHHKVAEMKDRIAGIDGRMANLGATRVASAVSGANPTYESVRLQEIAAQTRVDGLEAENESLRKATAHTQDRIIKPGVVSELDSLQLKLETLQDDYTHIAAALEEARTAELTNVPEVRVLFPATPIHEPVRPIRIYHVALSGLLAISLGIAAVFLTDFGKTLWHAPRSASA